MTKERRDVSMTKDELEIGLDSPFRLLALARKKLDSAGWQPSEIAEFMATAGQAEVVKYSAQDCPGPLVQRVLRTCEDVFR